MTSKQLFNVVFKKGEGRFGSHDIEQRFKNDHDTSIRYHVACGDLGSFEVVKHFEDEYYNTLTGEWEVNTREWYQFTSMHEIYDGYPEVTTEMAFKILQS